MKTKDFYQILGVSDTASAEEIKRAYRRKARLHHPDVSDKPGAEERFKEINEAYDTLKDEHRRAEYDQLKRYGFRAGDNHGGSAQWGGGSGFETGSYGNAEFGDLFESIFGAAGVNASRQANQRRQRAQQGSDIGLTVRVSLENAYHGGKTRISLPGDNARQLSVNIPAGVTDGQQLRLKSQGNPGTNGGPAGDLLLTIALKPHRFFKVEGNSVLLTVPVTPFEAATGIRINVPTLAGPVSLSIPPNTSSGAKLRLKGKGLPDAGDQIVTVQIQLPDSLSQASLEQLKQLDEEYAHEPRAFFEHTGVN